LGNGRRNGQRESGRKAFTCPQKRGSGFQGLAGQAFPIDTREMKKIRKTKEDKKDSDKED
jgi:hypothetical protein